MGGKVICCARSCLRLSDRHFWYSWIDCFAWSIRLWLCSILRPCSIDAIPLEVKHGKMDGSSTYAGQIFLVFEKEWCQTLHGKQKSGGSPWKSSYIMLHLCFIQGMVKRFSHLMKRIMQQRPVLNSKRRVLPLFCYITIALPLRCRLLNSSAKERLMATRSRLHPPALVLVPLHCHGWLTAWEVHLHDTWVEMWEFRQMQIDYLD